MNIFLSDKWFKTSVLAIGVAFLILFGYAQYLNTEAHTLNVINAALHCAEVSEGNEKAFTVCGQRAKSTLVFPSIFWKATE